MHTSRTFLGTEKAISDNLGLVNMGLVPFSCSISREIILGGIITVPLKSKLILETRTSHFEAQMLQVSRREDWVPSFEFWALRSKVFMWNYFCTVTQRFRNLHRRSVLAVQCTVLNCLNCQLRQAFNKCKSIFSVSEIYPAFTVYVVFARHVLRF